MVYVLCVGCKRLAAGGDYLRLRVWISLRWFGWWRLGVFVVYMVMWVAVVFVCLLVCVVF